ncbi:MAG: glycosyltransferase family 1 protein, partial [Acidobacteria bacterium]|nr:glycosyltransferase family 1 protein [Acidobacteriota bacterium]
MNILLPTDSFPPNCGGSGWSTYELARGLVERGHNVLVVKVVAGKSGAEVATHDNGIRVLEYHAYAPAVPGVRNYF